MKTCKMRFASGPVWTVVFFIFLIALPLQPAQALGSYEVGVSATMKLGGRPLELGLINIFDFNPTRQGDDNGPDLPSWVNRHPDLASSVGDAATGLVTLYTKTSGAAVFTGDQSYASANSREWVTGEFGVVNPTDYGFFLDVTVNSSLAFRASVQDGLMEYARTWYHIVFIGDIFSGTPENGIILNHSKAVRDPLEAVSGPLSFDLQTRILPKTYSLLIPPSFEVMDDRTIILHIYTIGLQALAGGEALSHLVLHTIQTPLRSHVVIRPRVISCTLKGPVKKRFASIRKTPRGLYELKAADPIDPNPKIFITDAVGTGPFGPFRSGDLVDVAFGGKEKDKKKQKQDVPPKMGLLAPNIRLKGPPIVTAVTDLTILRATAGCTEKAAGPRRQFFLAPMAPKIKPKAVNP